MRVQRSYIYIKEVRFHAFHGVMPQEQTVGQDYLVSVRCGVDISAAMKEDRLENTLNYAELYQLVAKEMSVPSKLIEHVAGRMAEAICNAFPQVESLDLTITKQNPPMGGDCQGAGVEVHLINDKTQS